MIDKDLCGLIKRAARNDNNAFAQLYQQKSREIIYLCIRELGNVQDGQDAAQEVFIHLYNSIGKLRNVEAFNVWMNRIVMSTCNKMRRTNMKHVAVGADEGFIEEVPDDTLDSLPQEFVEDEEGRRLMVQMVDKLPEKYRKCVLLNYYEKLSYAEISEVLGITTAAVDNNLRMARKQMRAQLEKRAAKDKKFDTTPMGAVVAFGPAMHAIFTQSAQSTVTTEMITTCASGWKAVAAKQVAAGATSLGKTTLTVVGSIMAIAAIGVLVATQILPSSSSLEPDTSVGQPQGMQQVSVSEDDDVGVLSLDGKFFLYRGGAAQDTPWPDVQVEAVPAQGDAGMAATAVSDAEGNFAFYGLAPGSYSLRVVLPTGMYLAAGGPGGQVFSPQTVYHIEPGGTAPNVGIPLNADVQLGGKLNLDAVGEPHSLQGAQMLLLDEEEQVIAAAPLDETGSFRFEELVIHDAGDYTLRVEDSQNALGFTIEDKSIYLYPGYGV